MQGMNRRTLLALGLAPLLPAALTRAAFAQAPAPAAGQATTDQDKADIARVQTYLDGLRTMKARFLQIAPNGQVTRGTTWLDRPGRMRFQYDPPTPLLLVAGHGLFVYYDSALKQTTNIPLGQTPLGILLANKVTLSGDVTVTQVQRPPNLLVVTLVRTASPGDGSLTLVFNEGPLTLREWIVLDAQRRETRVSLFDVQFGGTFESSLFEFVDPKFFQDNTGNGG